MDENSETPLDERESVATRVTFAADGTMKVFAYRFEGTHDCAGMNFESPKFKYISRVSANYKISSAASPPAGATNIDYTVKEIALAPMTAGAATKLNGSGGFCGVIGWEKPVDGKAQFKDITGRTNCKFDDDLNAVNMLKLNDIVQDIYKVEAN